MSARERLTDALYGAGWGTVKKLPEPVAVRLGRTIADAAWKRRGKGVLRLESNYARVVPGAGPERLAEMSRAGMRSYLRYWMESFRLPAWSPERIAESFTPEGPAPSPRGHGGRARASSWRCRTWPTGTSPAPGSPPGSAYRSPPSPSA